MSLEEQFVHVKPGDAGIIGNPIEHSLSPQFQKPALREWWTRAGKPAASAPDFHRFLVQVDELESALELVRNRMMIGINVTIPFKRAVCARLDWVDEFAKEVASVNTIKREDNRLLGYNTDGDGFETALKNDLKFSPEGKSALVLGLGGTGVVIIHKLLRMGFEKVFYWNRSAGKLLVGAEKNARLKRLSDAEAGVASSNVDLVVNATSVGLKPADGMPLSSLTFQRGQFVVDVIYNRDTEFLKRARSCGANVSGGLGMLLYQGAKAFEIWTGFPAPLQIMRKGLTSI